MVLIMREEIKKFSPAFLIGLCRAVKQFAGKSGKAGVCVSKPEAGDAIKTL